MKVLTVYSDPHCSCTVKSTFEATRALSKYCQADIVYYGKLKESHFKEYNIIVLQRLGGNGGIITPSFLEEIKNLIDKYKNETKIVYNIDDLLINTNSSIAKFASMADAILVPNESYNKYFKSYNKNIFYGGTFIDDENFNKFPIKMLSKKRFNLLWASTGLLGVSFMRKLIPEIQRSIPKAMIYIMGHSSLNYNSFRRFPQVRSFPILPYKDFVGYFKGADIYLNPIELTAKKIRGVDSNDFLNCKSEIKYVHAGLARVPIISSKSFPYEKAIKNRENGILLDNKVHEWVSAIKELEENKTLREKLIKNAYEDVIKNYLSLSFGKKLYDIYKSIYVEKPKKVDAPKKQIKKVNLSNYKITENRFSKKEAIKDISNTQAKSTLGEIFNNKKIYQNFDCNYNKLFKIRVMAATYQRENKGNFIIALLSDRNSSICLRKKVIDCKRIHDNSWLDFEFEPIENSKDRSFCLKIESTSPPRKSVTLYYNPSKEFGDLYIYNIKFKGSLVLESFSLK